jgi:hypothetical protein
MTIRGLEVQLSGRGTASLVRRRLWDQSAAPPKKGGELKYPLDQFGYIVQTSMPSPSLPILGIKSRACGSEQAFFYH